MKTALSALFHVSLILIFSLGLTAKAATTSSEDLDRLLATRTYYAEGIALLAQVAMDGNILNTAGNVAKLKALRDDSGYPYAAFNMNNVFYCPEHADLARLCFNENAKIEMQRISKSYTNYLFQTDYQYTTALSLINKDQLSQKHLAEMTARKNKLSQINQNIAPVVKKLEAAYGKGVTSLMLAIAAMTFLMLFVFAAAATAATSAGIGAMIFAAGFIISGVGSIGTLVQSVKSVSKLERQLAPLVNQKAQLSQVTILDESVIDILRKYEIEKNENNVQMTLP